MANFHALERLVDNAVGKTFSEQVKFMPRKNDGSRPDDGRLSLDLNGILHFPDEQGEISLRLGESRDGVDTAMTGIDVALVLQRSEYPDIGIRKKDLMRALDAPGTPWFSVERVNTSLSSIIIVYLVNDGQGA